MPKVSAVAWDPLCEPRLYKNASRTNLACAIFHLIFYDFPFFYVSGINQRPTGRQVKPISLQGAVTSSQWPANDLAL